MSAPRAQSWTRILPEVFDTPLQAVELLQRRFDARPVAECPVCGKSLDASCVLIHADPQTVKEEGGPVAVQIGRGVCSCIGSLKRTPEFLLRVVARVRPFEVK